MNHKKNTQQHQVTNDDAQIQSLFYAAFKNAVVRFIAKNSDQNQTDAEEAIFMALGYDPSTERKLTSAPPKSNKTTERTQTDHGDDDEGGDRDDDDATFVYFSDGDFMSDSDDDCHQKRRRLFYDQFNASFANKLRLFRCEYIMRDCDAIRSVRISHLFDMLKKEHNHYSDTDMLQYLTHKLDALYLPSPSPQPPSPSSVVLASLVEGGVDRVQLSKEKIALRVYLDEEDEDDDIRHESDAVDTTVLNAYVSPCHRPSNVVHDAREVSTVSTSTSSHPEERKCDIDASTVDWDAARHLFRHRTLAHTSTGDTTQHHRSLSTTEQHPAAPFYMAMPNIEYFARLNANMMEIALPHARPPALPHASSSSSKQDVFLYDRFEQELLQKKRKFANSQNAKSRKRSFQCMSNFSDDSQELHAADARSGNKRSRYGGGGHAHGHGGGGGGGAKNRKKIKSKNGRSRSRKDRMSSSDRDRMEKTSKTKTKSKTKNQTTKNASDIDLNDESDLELTTNMNGNTVSAP